MYKCIINVILRKICIIGYRVLVLADIGISDIGKKWYWHSPTETLLKQQNNHCIYLFFLFFFFSIFNQISHS